MTPCPVVLQHEGGTKKSAHQNHLSASDVPESISTAPSIESCEDIAEDPPERPPGLIQLPAARHSRTGSSSSITIAATRRKVSVGEKVLIVDTVWARDCVKTYIGQVGTVVGIPGEML